MAKNREQIRVFFIRRKWWTAAACLCLAALMFYAVNYPAAVGASASARQLPIYCVQRDQKLVSISFDAAWGNEDTQQLIDILGQYKVPATFFVVGEWVDKYPESVKALHDAGHEVMNHSNTHAHYPQLSADQVVADLNACNDKIEAVTGVRPVLVRLPYGDYDDSSINAVRSIGMEPIQWDVETSAIQETPCGTRILGISKLILSCLGKTTTPCRLTPCTVFFLFKTLERKSYHDSENQNHSLPRTSDMSSGVRS